VILHPLPTSGNADSPSSEFISGWDAVFRAQRVPASNWLLIAQPDHAVLAGDLAAHIQSRGFPPLSQEELQAISLHDEGWTEFDRQPQVRDGRPLSFLDCSPNDFLRAWSGSIECAERVGPLAALLVSEHFSRLARVSLETRGDDPSVRKFLQVESGRQERLLRLQPLSKTEIAIRVDVLQFCDLLSLYLCCGSSAAIEFPQKFDGVQVRLRREGEVCRLEPSLFAEGVSLGVSARKFPEASSDVSIPVLVV
jgi:hypothetical protein